mgnify:FL=1
MKLEVGMYVRLQNDAENIVIINRIANVFETTILTENDGSIYQGEYTKENVIKADYKIIKILEIGDYVNGCKVIKNTLKDGGNIIIVHGGNCFTNEEIKSIVTKEQIKQIAYKVGE